MSEQPLDMTRQGEVPAASSQAGVASFAHEQSGLTGGPTFTPDQQAANRQAAFGDAGPVGINPNSAEPTGSWQNPVVAGHADRVAHITGQAAEISADRLDPPAV